MPVCVCVCGYLWYMNMCVYCTCYQHALSAVCECVTVMPFTGRGQTLTCLSEQKNKSEHIWVLKTSTINKKKRILFGLNMNIYIMQLKSFLKIDVHHFIFKGQKQPNGQKST